MRWFITSFLMLLQACILSAPQDLPAKVIIDDSFSDDDKLIIIKGVTMTNDILGPHVGGDVIDAEFGSMDELSFDSFDDNVHGMHRASEGNPVWEAIVAGEAHSGYATTEDIILLETQFSYTTVQHELGHHLGMLHSNVFDSIMNADIKWAKTFTESDIEAFCYIYDCLDTGD